VLALPLMQLGLKQAGAVIPKTLHAPALDYACQRSKIMAALNHGPTTLIHHDLHPGNFYGYVTVNYGIIPLKACLIS
jgi:hypothetical protein